MRGGFTLSGWLSVPRPPSRRQPLVPRRTPLPVRRPQGPPNRSVARTQVVASRASSSTTTGRTEVGMQRYAKGVAAQPRVLAVSNSTQRRGIHRRPYLGTTRSGFDFVAAAAAARALGRERVIQRRCSSRFSTSS